MAFNSSLFDGMETNGSSSQNFLDSVFTNTSLGHRMLSHLTFTNFRHIFYIISPYESTFSSIDQVPNYPVQVFTWFLVLIALEFLILILRGQRDRIEVNDTITSMCAGMLSQVFKFGGRTIAIYAYLIIWEKFRVLELPWQSPWTWLLCFLTQDMLYYLAHRFVHEAGVFWALHAMHHSSEYYNFSTALRQAMIQDFGLAWFDLFQAFFIPPPIFLVHRYLNEVFQFLLHTSLFDDLGLLGLVFNTPSYHRVHHGRNPYCIDKNFGAVLIVWDRMFGTFEPERKDDPPIYGLTTTVNTFNQLWLQFSVFKSILIDKVFMKGEGGDYVFSGFVNKLKAVFYPPGYFPGMKTKRFFHWIVLEDCKEGIPQIEPIVIKYNPPVPLWIKLYCVGQFLMLMAVYYHFEHDRQDMTYTLFTLQVLFFAFTMQCLGAFFDNSWYACYLELVRCLCLFSYHCYLITDNQGTSPHRIFAKTVWLLSALLWAGYIAQYWVVRWQRNNAHNDTVHPADKSDNNYKSDGKTHALDTVSAKVTETEKQQQQSQEHNNIVTATDRRGHHQGIARNNSLGTAMEKL